MFFFCLLFLLFQLIIWLLRPVTREVKNCKYVLDALTELILKLFILARCQILRSGGVVATEGLFLRGCRSAFHCTNFYSVEWPLKSDCLPCSRESLLHKHFFVSSINFYNNLGFSLKSYRCYVGGGKGEGLGMRTWRNTASPSGKCGHTSSHGKSTSIFRITEKI